MPTDLREYYRVLELSPGASLDEIKRAYRQLLQQWHPDRYKPGSVMQTTAEDVTKELNEAYHQLCRKKRYLEFRPKPRPAATRVRTGATRDPWKRPPRHGWKVYEDVAAASRETPVAPPPTSAPPVSPPPAATPKRPRRAWRWPWRGIFGGLGIAAAIWLGVFIVARWPEGREATIVVSTPRLPTRSAPVTRIAAAPIAARPVVFAPRSETPFFESVSVRVLPLSMTWSEAISSTTTIAIATPPIASARMRAFTAPQVEEDAWSLLDTFAPGDTRARVIAVQGAPDEVGANLFRYGSSVVYFEDGRVTHWSEGRPRLRVLILPRFEFRGLARFGLGSTRAEVIRAQGEPTQTTNEAFYYGASAVYFDREWVTAWHEVDQPLRARPMPLSLVSDSFAR